jgi:hypothetical protein
MTDPHDPLPPDDLDPLDELASAHLDGHTTPDEAARVDGDPDLSARVARLEAARTAVRAAAVEPVGPARRDAALAAALAAFDAAAPPVPRTAPSNVVPLTSRWRATRRTFQLVGIAAAVALLALAVPLLGRLDSGSDDDQSDEAATALEERDAADGGSAADRATSEDAAAGADSTTTMAALTLPHLGAYANIDELADTVRAQLAGPVDRTPAAEQSTAYSALSGCAAEATARIPAPRLVALATLDGRAVVILVRDDDDGGALLEVLDSASCELITTTPL